MTNIPHLDRRLARLAAVQALYLMSQADIPASRVIQDFIQDQFRHILGDEPIESVDIELFRTLVEGTSSDIGSLDAMIRPYLVDSWSLERLEMVALAILRVGSYELQTRLEVPAIIIISEYSDIAHAFFEAREAGFVNGVLNKLARSLRETEFAGRPGRASLNDGE